jgi:hypothetical protein
MACESSGWVLITEQFGHQQGHRGTGSRTRSTRSRAVAVGSRLCAAD